MNENDFDSSKNEYFKTIISPDYIKQSEWDLAIGLQEVDNLKPSEYLKKVIDENILGNKSIYEIEEELKNYYNDKKNNFDKNEYECDLVSTKIVQILQEDDFELSINFIKHIHKYLFKDIYSFAGDFRNYNFSKHEIILSGDSAFYGDFNLIEKSLEYDLNVEKNKNYSKMNIVDVIKNITDFTSRIWQIHPFEEGNTRTTVVFIIKYLKKLGYEVNNTLFKDKSVYFRNALVRSNYYNKELKIESTQEFLIKFFENLLLSKNNNLSSKDLIIDELIKKEN